MPERRMFTKKITESDAFLDMPTSAQALYFHLSMNADDDGFVNSPKSIQRTVGASSDDLKLLVIKKFIIAFESGVIVIKHWKMHNYLRNDRYKPTDYQDELALLQLDDKNAYTQSGIPNGNQMDTNGIPMVSIGKDRLGKDSKDKDSLGKVNKKTKALADASTVYFPNDELLNTAFCRYIEMRKAIKKPLTEYAATLHIKKLLELSTDNNEQLDIINKAISKNWLDFYPLTKRESGGMSEADAWLNA